MKVDICNKKRTNPENSRAQTVFLREIEYESGTGEGLTFEITKELEIQHISMSKVLGFGSDGASVMTRQWEIEQTESLPFKHRLILCAAQAADGIPALKSTRNL